MEEIPAIKEEYNESKLGEDFNDFTDFLEPNLEEPDYDEEPDYLDYCESKLEEFDEEVDYDYEPDYGYEDDFKRERKPKKPKIKKERVPAEPKIHKCPICEIILSKSSHLNRHILSVHKGQTPFKCTLCE